MAFNPKSKENLIPAKKGEVRNPEGKKKGTPNTKTLLKKLLAVKILDKESGEEMTVHEQMMSALLRRARNGERKAIKEILDRYEGRPMQAIELKEKTIDDLESLTDEQLKERGEAIYRKLNDSASSGITED